MQKASNFGDSRGNQKALYPGWPYAPPAEFSACGLDEAQEKINPAQAELLRELIVRLPGRSRAA
jgi:hypothetical protein